MENSIDYSYGDYRKLPLTKWQKTVQDVLREQRRNGEYISLPIASKIASERYLIACIEEDNAKHPDARRSARLQKKATLTAPPIQQASLYEMLDDPLQYYRPAFLRDHGKQMPSYHDSSDDDCDSIDTPLTDEEIDSALYDLEKHYD